MRKSMTVNGKKVSVPPFPHHKYFLSVVSKFFNSTDILSLIATDNFKLLDQVWSGIRNKCFVPRCLLLDPTSSCNLQCVGCWSAGYHKRDNLSYETLDNILEQAEALNINYCFLSGGEPLVRKDDLLKLCEKHRKMSFSAFTNGTLIDEAFADRVAELSNLTFSLSIEGFEENTDFRRGKGVYSRVIRAMDILASRDIAFAFSACYHSKNYKEIASDEFLDFMREKGCWMGWLFTYMPVGNDADLSLVCTPEQRAYVRKKILSYNKKHDITIIDFWNSGHMAAGCVAASTGFVHINSRGDIEPCAFCHYSDSNIHEVSLKDALNSAFFRAFRDAQPFSDNPLRSCPLIDVPEKLVEVVENSGAHSTELASPENVRDLAAKTKPIAEKWQPLADRLYSHCPDKHKRCFKTNKRILGFRKSKNTNNPA